MKDDYFFFFFLIGNMKDDYNKHICNISDTKNIHPW